NQHLLLISRWTKWLVKQGELTFQIPEMRFEMKKRGRDIVDYDKHLTLVNEGEHNFQIDKTPLLRLTISPIERIKCSTLLTWNTNSPNEQADDVLNSGVNEQKDTQEMAIFEKYRVTLEIVNSRKAVKEMIRVNLTWIYTSGTNGIPMVLAFLRYDLGRNSHENRVTAKQSPKWQFVVTSIDQRDVVWLELESGYAIGNKDDEASEQTTFNQLTLEQAIPLDRIDPSQVPNALNEFTQKPTSTSADLAKAEAEIGVDVHSPLILLLQVLFESFF
ncbi:hypothetical protein Tco_1189451, partial [Tanacetum coccineum]